ncbi:carotenoid biosynthesis protein [Deinococcus sp. Marseille-Q6407]|uniref:carotenoid biosynthesis protein n=1 Tax=Deinococcus sp. Marseille-Q6407 TaxID=2969223 RepID=UPI0028FC1111|nr:carotenoid biosynthesis protein [Deinococcus sp. Marseille-Q6407]
MTYLQFHLIFILPPLLLLLWLTARRRGPLAGEYCPDDRWTRLWLGVLLAVAFIYTTPWDNYLVYTGGWEYPPERVLGTVGYVPYEEYAFFLLQTLLSSLFLLWLMRRPAAPFGGPAQVSPRPLLSRWGMAALWLGGAMLGAAALVSGYPPATYFGLIAAWALPVLAGQWAFGGDLILGKPRLFWTAVLLPTFYLWAADAFALHNGIWSISEGLSLGPKLGPLPLEEMLFFLVTNLLVVTGLMLFLHPQALRRLEGARPLLKPWLGLLAGYLLLKIPVPLWPAGFPLLATLSTGALFGAALLYAAGRVGWGRALGLGALCFGAGWAVEYLGSTTGFPFGQYSYAGAPGPTLLGVPLLVPLGWFALTLATTALSRGRPWLAGLLLAAWDVGLEALMTAQGFWTWSDPRPLWAGAPLQNFLGWWAVGTALSLAVTRLAPQLRRPERGPDLSLAYLTELFFLPGGLLLLGQPLAAGVTLLVMLAALLLARALAPAPRLSPDLKRETP